MYPDLSYFIYDLVGIGPDNVFAIVKTFGLFLAIAVFCAAVILNLEFKRKEKEGVLKPIKEEVVISQPMKFSEVIVNGLIGFFIGFKGFFAYFHFDDFRVDPSGVIFSSEGHMAGGILGLLFFGGYTYWQYQKNKNSALKKKVKEIYPHMRVSDIAIRAALWGVIGSKLFSVLENFGDFIRDPIGELFSGSGLTIYGGLILAFIMVVRYVKSKGIDPIHVMDSAAPSLVVGYGVGRLGCQFSGDGDWGIENTLPKPDWFFLPDWVWAWDYPRNVLNKGVAIADCDFEYCHRLEPMVFPTPIWEVMAMTLIFAILWSIRKRVKIPGMLFFIYLFFNGLERFFIEFYRVNPRYDIFGYDLSQAQFIALAFMAIGIGACLYLRKNKMNTIG